MQKLLAILLLALFGLPVVSPLFALGSSPDASLPSCCRRDGKHHCMGMTDATGKGTVVSAPRCCESFPKALTPTPRHPIALDTASLAFAELLSHPAVRPQTEARARVALDRSRRKRGPPAIRLS